MKLLTQGNRPAERKTWEIEKKISKTWKTPDFGPCAWCGEWESNMFGGHPEYLAAYHQECWKIRKNS